MGGGGGISSVLKKPFKGGKQNALTSFIDPMYATGHLIKERYDKKKADKASQGEGVQGEPLETGQLSETEADDISRKRMFRLGFIFTSPTGLGQNSGATSRAKLT